MDMEKVNRLNNEYRSLIREARALREERTVPTREEGLCYQNASERAGQLASMSIGAEMQHWIREQDMCSTKMREIWYYLNPEEAKKRTSVPETPSAVRTSSKENPAKPAQRMPKSEALKPNPGAAKGTDPEDGEKKPKKNTYGIPDSVVENWIQADPGYGFDQVAGMEDLKELLNDCVQDVSCEELNAYLDIPTVQSFFFYGPPGCGKTFIIKAFAHELMQKGYRYMKLESSDVHSKFSGEADKIVKRAFAEAKEEPTILFMDEIDGICQSRSIPNLSDFNMSLTTTFLNAYNDLIDAGKERRRVIFIGATNYPANVDVGMLDRVELVPVPLPDEAARAASFRSKFMKKQKTEAAERTDEAATATEAAEDAENQASESEEVPCAEKKENTPAVIETVQCADDFSWEEMAEATEGYNQRDIDHVISHLRVLLRKAALSSWKNNSSNAIEALKNGECRITREMFQSAMKKYHPSPKDDIEKSLNEFTNKMRNL